MSNWVLKQTFKADAQFTVTAVASTNTTLASGVSLGDTILLRSEVGANSSILAGKVTDNLGNHYIRVSTGIFDATNTRSVDAWWTIVTVAGTPTITYTPDNANQSWIGFDGVHFAGSWAISTLRAWAFFNKVNPGTAANAIASTQLQCQNGDLLWASIAPDITLAGTITHGTGFVTDLAPTSNGWTSEHKVPITIDSGIFTDATNGGANTYIGVVMAITPAVSWQLMQAATSPNSGSAVASRTAVLNSGVAYGDLLIGAVTYDTTNSIASSMNDATKGANRDNLGNVWYMVPGRILSSAHGQASEIWYSVVEFPGIPTVRLEWGPVPGTTTNGSCQLMVAHFEGSDINTTLTNFSGTTINPGGATTSTDGIPAGPIAWINIGSLLISYINDDGSSNATINPGTGWTLAFQDVVDSFLIQFRVPTNPSSLSATASSSAGTITTDDFFNLTAAFTPALSKGFIPKGGQTATVKGREHFNPAIIDSITPL